MVNLLKKVRLKLAKKNLPNIPIYIGDWERDCNVLSLESEMAWMKIIFKMHLAGKQSVYKSSTKGLQILWKSSAEKVNEILEELRFNDICGITEITGGLEFLCRRLKKENEISEVRSEAVSNRYKPTKKLKSKSTKPLQTTYKTLQNADIDIDIENESDNEIEVKTVIKKNANKKNSKNERLIIPEDFEPIWNDWLDYRKAKKKKPYAGLRWEQIALNKFIELSNNNSETAKLILEQTISQNWEGLFELKTTQQNGKSKQGIGNKNVTYSTEFQRKITDGLQS